MDQKNMIIVRGASENNLKGVDLDIPKNKIVVFTGLSGSGKSSLVFDTIAVESMRQLNETFPAYVRYRMPYYPAPKAERIDNLTTAITIDQRPFTGDIRSTVGTMSEVSPLLRLLFSRCAEPSAGPSGCYSFNDPDGMCLHCGGLGKTVEFKQEALFDMSKSLNQGAILFAGHEIGTYQWQIYAHSVNLDADKPLAEFTEEEWDYFLHGSGEIVEIKNTTGKVWDKAYNLTYEGFLDRITRLYLKKDINTANKAVRNIISRFTREHACPACGGRRLNPAALASRLRGRDIYELGEMEVTDLAEFLKEIDDPVGIPAAQKILAILREIEEMGLGYLNINRPSNTLSGGEAQRLKMVRHLGSSLTGLTYIFDEPTIGLHPKDVERLVRLLTKLRDKGNTILVVEHDEDIIRLADWVVDMGPGAGKNGGRICFRGTLPALMESGTQTGQWLGRELALKRQTRRASGAIPIRNACLHNLQHVDVDIPKNVLTVVTGLAGSGKSSLVCGELLAQVPAAVHISQAPIGTTSRSTPASYTGALDEIRKLFGRTNHVSASLFSSNSKGACPVCKGKGVTVTEMAFMSPITVTCEACEGRKFSNEVLEYKYKGKSIYDVMNMTVSEAAVFFPEGKIHDKLASLAAVGMDYVTLGQPTSTMSGGECQRLKLASYIDARDGIYVMDEPTTGLHGKDIELLMKLIDRLVDQGSTVIVVEHDLDVIRQADWIIDMGPAGGKNGGRVIFRGTPEQLLDAEGSATAEALRERLGLSR